jgi:hypothetical protein
MASLARRITATPGFGVETGKPPIPRIIALVRLYFRRPCEDPRSGWRIIPPEVLRAEGLRDPANGESVLKPAWFLPGWRELGP